MGVLINQMKESFRYVYIYQATTMYTLNILQFCQLYLNKARIKKKKKDGGAVMSAGEPSGPSHG